MILIVEDDEIARGAMGCLLAAWGYDAVAVESAEEALQLLASGRKPDAAVVDWDLPGMSGLELIARLQETAPGTRAVLVTGAARERLESDVRLTGIPYLRKPLDFRGLLRILPPRVGSNQTESN